MTHPNSFYRLNGISLRSVQTKKWSRENTFIIPRYSTCTVKITLASLVKLRDRLSVNNMITLMSERADQVFSNFRLSGKRAKRGANL